MDASHRQEVYIPEDAQVGSIPLWTIPDRLLDRMGVPTRPSSSSSSSSCGAPGPSPEGTWISPVRIRKRTHLAAVSGDPDGGEIPLCSRRRTPPPAAAGRGSPPPVEVPFVTSNRLALEVLQDLLQGTRSPHPAGGGPTGGGPAGGGRTLLPRVSAPPLHQDAVIAYRGNIFLSIRRSHGRGRGGGGGPRVAPPTPTPTPAPTPALGPVSTVPDSPPAVKSTGEPPRTQRPPRPPGGLHLPGDPSAPHPDPGDPSAPHPDPGDPAPPHPDPEDLAAPAPPHPEDPAPPHPDPEEPAAPAAPHPEDPAPPHPDPEDPSAPPHPDPGEESEGVPSETPGTPTTVHPAASSGPLLGVQDHLVPLGVQDHLVPLHRGGLGPPGQQNYRTCDFEALELDEKIARMKVKLRESEEALRRGCS